jgi:hypothetical protein
MFMRHGSLQCHWSRGTSSAKGPHRLHPISRKFSVPYNKHSDVKLWLTHKIRYITVICLKNRIIFFSASASISTCMVLAIWNQR